MHNQLWFSVTIVQSAVGIVAELTLRSGTDLRRPLHGVAEPRTTVGDNRELFHRVHQPWQRRGDEGMPHLVVRHHLALPRA
jgi:hypothetical protein